MGGGGDTDGGNHLAGCWMVVGWYIPGNGTGGVRLILCFDIRQLTRGWRRKARLFLPECFAFNENNLMFYKQILP